MDALLKQASKLPGVGGVAAVVPGVAAVLPGKAASTDFQAQGAQTLKQKILDGMPFTSKIILAILCGFPGIPPFSFWGHAGVNLMVSGSKLWAAAKAATQFIFVGASNYISAYYPNLKWINWILFLSPWFVFDFVQLLSPAFYTEGFKVPFLGWKVVELEEAETVNNMGTQRLFRINGLVIGVMFGLFALGGFSLLSLLPPQVVGAAEPALKMVFKIIGGIAAVGGGGLGMILLPKLLSSLKEDAVAVKAAAAVAPAAPVVAAAAAPGTLPAPAAALPVKQAGGAAAGSIPPLHEVAAGLLNPASLPRGAIELGAPFRSTVMTGGGSGAASPQPAKADSVLFVSILGLAALAGLGLAVVRSKAE